MYLSFRNSHRHTQVCHHARVVWFASPVERGENRSLQVMLFSIDNTKCGKALNACTDRILGFLFLRFVFVLVWPCVGS